MVSRKLVPGAIAAPLGHHDHWHVKQTITGIQSSSYAGTTEITFEVSGDTTSIQLEQENYNSPGQHDLEANCGGQMETLDPDSEYMTYVLIWKAIIKDKCFIQ